MLRAKAVILTGVSLLALAGPAWAQDSKPPQDPVLKGPKVRDGSTPGESRRFSGGNGGPRDRMGQETPHRVFVRAFDVLRADQADMSVRLTDEQDAKLRTINEDFTKAAQSYREQHEAEVRDLAKNLAPEDRRRLQAFLAGGPDGRRLERSLDGKQPKNAAKNAKPADGDEMNKPSE